jgi:hypothetical protein
MKTPTQESLQQFSGKVFRTLREAVHHTATQNGPMKNIAAELDWSPSDLCLRTTLGTDNARPFPLDDPAERAIRIQELTGDHSILATMADRLGYELRPKQDRYPELVQNLAAEAKRLTDAIQLVLSVPLVQQQPAAKGRR